MTTSDKSEAALIIAAKQLISDKFYSGKEVAPIIQVTSLYQNRLREAISDLRELMKAIEDYSLLNPAI